MEKERLGDRHPMDRFDWYSVLSAEMNISWQLFRGQLIFNGCAREHGDVAYLNGHGM
jgi:hypothetical protein